MLVVLSHSAAAVPVNGLIQCISLRTQSSTVGKPNSINLKSPSCATSVYYVLGR